MVFLWIIFFNFQAQNFAGIPAQLAQTQLAQSKLYGRKQSQWPSVSLKVPDQIETTLVCQLSMSACQTLTLGKELNQILR